MTTVVSERLPGAVTTANSAQVAWCAVVWIVNERRWQCCVPPQAKLCRMPYVFVLPQIRDSVPWRVSKFSTDMPDGQTCCQHPSSIRQPGLKKTKPYFLMGRVSLHNDESCTCTASLSEVRAVLSRPSSQEGVGTFVHVSHTQWWQDHIANVTGYRVMWHQLDLMWFDYVLIDSLKMVINVP